MAVSKKFSSSTIKDAYECGCRDFGENYVQEFADKQKDLKTLEGAHFHLIGHLQSNKSRLACQLFQTIQTVDSPKLLKRIDAAAAELGIKMRIMVEVKLAQEEESKTGCAPDEIPALQSAAADCRHVALSGLMTIPPWSENGEQSRPYFRQLTALARKNGLPQVSMGMSNDLEVAIEEGATIIRIGTALFGQRPKPAAASLQP